MGVLQKVTKVYSRSKTKYLKGGAIVKLDGKLPHFQISICIGILHLHCKDSKKRIEENRLLGVVRTYESWSS